MMLLFRITNNRLLAIRTNRNDLDGHTQFLFQECQVSIELFGEFVFALHLCHVGLPAGHFDVDRLYIILDGVREFGYFLAPYLVSHARLYRIERIQDIALHHDKLADSVEHDGILQRYQVNPTAAAFTTGNSSELVPQLPYLVAHFVEQLCRERTASDACAIGLEDIIDLANIPGRDT